MEATYKIDPVQRPLPPAGGYASLLFSAAGQVHAFALREGQSHVVGRADPAEWIVDDRSLSRVHARLSLRDGEVTLEDLGSTNGCLLNGNRVQKGSLGEGDVAQLGAVELRVAAQTRLLTQLDMLSEASFLKAVADELTRARLFGRSASVLAIKHDDSGAAREALQRVVKPLNRLCQIAPSISLVLLPEQDAAAATRWLNGIATTQQARCCVGVASFPALSSSAAGMVSRALDACLTATAGSVVECAPTLESSASPVTRSACMLRLYDLVGRAALTTIPVLIQGETGSGKELVATALHQQSPRAKGPFKALNCATIPTNLLESVLFGHERGAFTGAERQVVGVFEQTQGGTVFLDEVGELSLQAQAALLRVLESRRIVRVGGTKEIPVDVRVVAATHRNLATMVQAGTFREDLMFRLDALTLRVPPLRERKEDILPLAELFLARARERWAVTATQISEDARDTLLTYAWPGNVRQLKNAIERAAVICAGAEIQLEDLPEQVLLDGDQTSPPEESSTRAGGDARCLPERVRDFEIGIIRDALERAHGNQAEAARLLGVPRRTLANKVHAFGLLEHDR